MKDDICIAEMFKRHPHVVGMIQEADTESITVVSSKTGEAVPVVRCDGKEIALHSTFDPVKEASRFIDQIDCQTHNLFVVVGFGFGFHVEVLLDQIKPADVLLVIEKDPALVRSAAENRDLSGILSDERLILCIDPGDDMLSSVLRGKSSRSVVFVTHRGSYRVRRDYYENMIQMVKSYLSSKEVNIATLAKFEKLWTINCAKNAAVLIESVPASSYYGRFQDTDAVIVGAGPSLVDTLPELTKIQESCLIIAVDTSYRICLDNGVIPHFVLCADPQLINARYFEQITESDTVLIADPACHPSVLRLFKGPHALSGMPFDMFSWIEEITGEMGEITHGGSVSTNAYDFAKRLGVPRVYLVGQDLGFTHNLAHCRGSYLDEMMFLKVNRFYNQEMANRRQLRALPAIYQPAIGGGTVQTNQKMMIFKQWFERRNDPALLNASSGGMELFAIPHSPLPKGGSAADIRSRVMSIHDAGRISGSERMRRRERVRERIDRISNENDLLLEKLVQAVEHALRLREVIGQRGAEREAQQLIGKLDAVDEYIGRFSASKSIVGMSVQRTIHTVQEGYDLDTEECSDAERIAGRSHYLYSGLLDGCRFTRRVLAKMSRLFNAS